MYNQIPYVDNNPFYNPYYFFNINFFIKKISELEQRIINLEKKIPSIETNNLDNNIEDNNDMYII